MNGTALSNNVRSGEVVGHDPTNIDGPDRVVSGHHGGKGHKEELKDEDSRSHLSRFNTALRAELRHNH